MKFKRLSPNKDSFFLTRGNNQPYNEERRYLILMDKKKILTLVGIVATTVISTLFSTMMQDREIEKNVKKHFDGLESKK